MKKLLALMLVLGITTAANATILLSVNGDTSIDEVSICPEGKLIIDVFDTLANDPYGCWVGTVDAEGNQSTLGEWTGNYTIYPAAGQGDVVGPDAGWWFAEAITGDPDGHPLLAGKHFDFEFECDGVGVVYISLTDAAGTPIDSITINQVPEPASMLLLGLGGLLLRRRK